MLLTIDRTNRPQERAALRAMFEARKSIFVDRLKYDLPVLADRYEVDQFDGHDAVYLVLVDRDGRHRASARLLATTRPCILNSLCADLCDGPLPQGAGVWEISRFCLSRELCARERQHVRNQLVTAIVRHGLAQDIGAYVSVAEMGRLSRILSLGWECAPLGLPKKYDGAVLGALRIDIRRDTLARLCRADV
jgi:acyl-homoserine lactone synthase